MTPLLIATTNTGKRKEIEEFFQSLPLTILDLANFPMIEPIPETGLTFEENACLKASGYARQARVLTLSDDSGLMVDSLGGAPGVLSARYGGEDSSYEEKIEKLLAQLRLVPQGKRTAQFVSVIAMANQQGEIIDISAGTCTGEITFAPRGTHGFGYDPIFRPDGFDQTFAQLALPEKNRISHRSRALFKTHAFLRSLTAA